MAHVWLSSYALWVHSHSFVTLVCCPEAYPESHVVAFCGLARRVGLVLEETILPYVQLAPVTIKRLSFLQGSSQVRMRGHPPPPPVGVIQHGHMALGVIPGGDGTYVCVSEVGEKGGCEVEGPSRVRYSSAGAFGCHCLYVQDDI